MSEPMFVISEDELSAIEIILKQAGIPIKRNVLLTEIRSRKLSTELETAYRHGFNDGQAEGLVWMTSEQEEKLIRKAEREKILMCVHEDVNDLVKEVSLGMYSNHGVFEELVKISKRIDSLRSEP